MGEFFRFRVQLKGAKPPVFRQFLLTANATFLDLHKAIQDACGWQNAHLFAFRTPGGRPIAGGPEDADPIGDPFDDDIDIFDDGDIDDDETDDDDDDAREGPSTCTT